MKKQCGLLMGVLMVVGGGVSSAYGADTRTKYTSQREEALSAYRFIMEKVNAYRLNKLFQEDIGKIERLIANNLYSYVLREVALFKEPIKFLSDQGLLEPVASFLEQETRRPIIETLRFHMWAENTEEVKRIIGVE